MNAILFQFCSNWFVPLFISIAFFALVAIFLSIINPQRILWIRLKRISAVLGAVAAVTWLTFTILSNNTLTPASWFKTLTTSEQIMMKNHLEHTHRPISMLKFIELQHRYERYTTSKEAANMQLGALNKS